MQLARSESQEQIAFIKRARLILPPELERRLWGSMAGAHTSKKTAGISKAMGNRPGIPDIEFAKPLGGFHGLYIEMKKLHPVKGRASPEQRVMIAELNEDGYSAHFAYGADEAFDILQAYLKLDS